MGLLGKFFAKFARNDFSLDDERELTNVLIESDLGSTLTEKILDVAKSHMSKSKNEESAFNAVKSVLHSSLMEGERTITRHDSRPTVILIVGVNGTGKTTSVAKLAKWLSKDQQTVLLAAADTFRAAAVDQLSTWANRLGIQVVVGESGADPASVAFEAASRAVKEKFSYLIIDTAGRLHTKSNLMDELSKIKRVVEKITPIDETLFVLDGTTGQNGIVQAKTFAQSVPLTGLIVTKLDGSAKGGVAIATEMELKTPIKFIGTGENEDDFAVFNPENYIESLLS